MKIKKSFDLNNDGVVDKKDAKMAGQVLASFKKNSKKNVQEPLKEDLKVENIFLAPHIPETTKISSMLLMCERCKSTDLLAVKVGEYVCRNCGAGIADFRWKIMVSYNLGSVANRVWNLIDNIPTSISGAEMLALADDQRLYMEEYTGLSIGSVGIAERFQPALVMLTAGAVQGFIEGQGSDKTFNLGDLSVTRNNFNDSASNFFTKDGMEKLKRIGRKSPFYLAYGWRS